MENEFHEKIELSDLEPKLYNFFQNAKKIYKEIENTYENNLKSFFNNARSEYKTYIKIKKELDRYLSTDFNFIDIISPGENKISDILELLLNPNETHGQGSKFLKIFLDKLRNILKEQMDSQESKPTKTFLDNLCSSELYTIEEAQIEREKDIKQGIIDLFITINGYVIAIENKPWANEQQYQMQRYFNYLNKKEEKKVIKGFLLVYLSGSGKEPTSISPETKNKNKGKLMSTSYRELLLPWLKDCYKECESLKVKFFINDLFSWIEKKFKEDKEE